MVWAKMAFQALGQYFCRFCGCSEGAAGMGDQHVSISMVSSHWTACWALGSNGPSGQQCFPPTSFRRLTSIKALWRWHVEFVVEFFRKPIQCSLKEHHLIHYRELQADRHLEKSWSSFLCGEVKQTMTINLIFSGSLHQFITHLTSLCTRSYEMCWGDED